MRAGRCCPSTAGLKAMSQKAAASQPTSRFCSCLCILTCMMRRASASASTARSSPCMWQQTGQWAEQTMKEGCVLRVWHLHALLLHARAVDACCCVAEQSGPHLGSDGFEGDMF